MSDQTSAARMPDECKALPQPELNLPSPLLAEYQEMCLSWIAPGANRSVTSFSTVLNEGQIAYQRVKSFASMHDYTSRSAPHAEGTFLFSGNEVVFCKDGNGNEFLNDDSLGPDWPDT